MSRIIRVAALVLAVVAFGLWPAPGSRARAAASEQIVFSNNATGFGTFGGTATPFGFWVWCEGDSANPYQGECNGSLYFYALGLIKHVTGTVTEPAEGQYQMHVTAGSAIDCTLTNVPPVTKGPTNTVNVSCKNPAGKGTSTAVVNVTGP